MTPVSKNHSFFAPGKAFASPVLFVVFALTMSLGSGQTQADLLASLDYNNGFSARTQVGAAAVGEVTEAWNGSASFFGFVGTETPSGNTGGSSPFGSFELAGPDGVASGVSYQMTFVNDGDFGFNGAFDAAGASTQATGAEDLFGDYIFVGGADGGEALNFVVSGLTANTDYELYLYGVGDAVNQGATWTLGGVSKTSSYDGNTTVDEGADYVLFEFNTGAGTTQSFSATELAGNIAVNGFQIVEVTAVPEPSALSVLALGIVGLSLFRRRN